MDEVMTASDAKAGTLFTPSSSVPSSLPSNLPLLSAFLAFALAQFLKIFTTWYKEKRWDSKRILDSGGMPSSHSATVSALAVAIGLQEGTGTGAFAIALVLACIIRRGISALKYKYLTLDNITPDVEFDTDLELLGINNIIQHDMVMYDASGVRLHAGRQAELLNQIVCEFPPEHPLSNVRPLRDSLGHTPIQVVAGCLLGFAIAFLMRSSV